MPQKLNINLQERVRGLKMRKKRLDIELNIF